MKMESRKINDILLSFSLREGSILKDFKQYVLLHLKDLVLEIK
jgi:hypothetical protein